MDTATLDRLIALARRPGAAPHTNQASSHTSHTHCTTHRHHEKHQQNQGHTHTTHQHTYIFGDTRKDREPDANAVDAFQERAAICEFDGGLTWAHAEAFAALQTMEPPDGISPQGLAEVIDLAARRLDRMRSRRQR